MSAGLRSALIISALAVASASAGATTVPVSNGGFITTPSFEWTNNGSTDLLANNNLLYAIDPAGGGITFQHSFTASPGSPLSNSTGTNPNIWNFQDTIAFTLSGPVNGDVLTATLNLGSLVNLSNLQIRLYGWTNGVGVTNPPLVGAPVGTSEIVPWQPGSNGIVTASFANVPAGTYYLDIRGNVTGSAGGSYVGLLNVQPVPLPAALPLLLAGLGLVGLRRRRTH